MTCVIGTERWICADRRITSSTGERCPSELKVWQGAYLIAACAGAARGIHKARKLVESGEACVPEGLIDAVGDDAHALVLTREGRLYEVSEGAVYRRRSLWCIGTGGDIARGYLEGRALTLANAKDAQRLAARLRDDCGGGVNVRSWVARP
jgi:hypothetical protein